MATGQAYLACSSLHGDVYHQTPRPLQPVLNLGNRSSHTAATTPRQNTRKSSFHPSRACTGLTAALERNTDASLGLRRSGLPIMPSRRRTAGNAVTTLCSRYQAEGQACPDSQRPATPQTRSGSVLSRRRHNREGGLNHVGEQPEHRSRPGRQRQRPMGPTHQRPALVSMEHHRQATAPRVHNREPRPGPEHRRQPRRHRRPRQRKLRRLARSRMVGQHQQLPANRLLLENRTRRTTSRHATAPPNPYSNHRHHQQSPQHHNPVSTLDSDSRTPPSQATPPPNTGPKEQSPGPSK